MIIGICGKSGSGKSSLAKEIMSLTDRPCLHLDIDSVGHQVLLLPEVQKELINSFGENIVKENIVDRKRLGEKVFDSRNEMKLLSDITWKYMQLIIDDYLDKNSDKMIILDWLLLPLTKYYNDCDIKILLDVPYSLRKQRAMKRDNISEEAFTLREKASIDYSKETFDYIINDNNSEIIKRLVKKL